MAKSIVIATALILLTAYAASGQLLTGSRSSNSSTPGNSTGHNSTDVKNDTKLCITCTIYCEFGYVMASNGCPSCTCIKPCENVTCSAGKKCKEVPSIMCGSQPCPNTTYIGECVVDNSTVVNRNDTKNDTKLCITCAIFCEFGNVMGNDGCPTCKCNNPCENVTCSSGKKCNVTASIMCGSKACPNATYTAECVLDKNDPCSKCAEQCPYGFNKNGSTCTECKCIEPCAGVNCYAGRKCQAIAIDICNDKPCANSTYLGLCVPTANACPVPCLNFCEFGFVTGANGCPTCECAHPCKNFTCEYGKKCKEFADRWCGSVACPNTTYSPRCELCTPCQKFCPYGNYIASDGCPSCDCMEPCRGFSCQEGFKCHAKPSTMCGSKACANATYYPECIERKCATCKTICPFGYNKGADGCPNCECKEPCKNVQCDRGKTCVEIPDVMCGDKPCANSTYRGQCVIEENECVSCAYPCPYGNVKGLDGCPTCVCVQPCMNVQCSSGRKCIAEKRPLCGNEPCANSTYTGVCVDAAAAANKTDNTQQLDDWKDTGLNDVTHLIQEVQVCRGFTEILSCPDDQEIRILRAFYGRNSSTTCLQGASASAANLRFSLPGVTSLLQELCDDRQTCELSPDLDLFGQPQAGVSLYVKAEYLCRPRRHQTLQCSNSGRMRLECKPGTTLNIVSAMYGRDDLNTTCPHPFAEVTDNCSNPRALETVQSICNGRSSCYVGADSHTFADPCPHSNKYLRMEYECVECSNAYGDDVLCQFWANQGACDNNKNWMMNNCRKACTRCEVELACVNGYNDTQCDIWAASNECTNNPTFMFAYCRKSCLKCDRTTDCINQYNSTACDTWMRSNECAANPNFMLSICTKSCFFCSGNVKCANNYPDKDCDLWAIRGECDKNPGFMVSQCYKSCFNCDKDPVCANTGASDAQCDQWAKQDECKKNPTFMYRYCWKSCMQCQAHQPACTNSWGDVWCEYAALQGQCSRDMMNVCYKSCSRCAPTPTVGDCLNVNNTMCAEMVKSGQCTSDPVKAMRVCKRACTMCDQPTVYTSYIGGGLMPGELLDGVSGYTVITPQPIKSFGRLAYFSAFFMSNASFYIQIWRPWYTDNFYLIHDQFVTPTAANYAQTIPVEKCVQVTAGDRIGFTTMRGAPPMATSFDPDMAAKNAYIRQGNKQDKFTPVGLSIRFSLNAHTVPGNC